MGKQNPKVATLLYRKSNCTLNTHSRTCSGASQIFTKSGIIRMKKKLPKTSYYIDNGKVKRDLSIATDICLLRRYYKKKFGSYKYSINTSEVGTIDELNNDKSACGDKIPEENQDKLHFNIDVTSLVVDNLKQLLNDWIKKYLLNNTETKQKIETVLDTILHKIDRHNNSSSCSYMVNIKVDEEKYSGSNNAKNKANKQAQCSKVSRQTVPVSGKRLKLISTLSIPRNIKKHVNDNNLVSHPTRKVRYKNVFLTVSRSSTFLLNSSSFNLLSISTKSFTKRCVTYEGIGVKSSEQKQGMILGPKSSYSETIPDPPYKEDMKMELDIGNQVYPNVMEPMQSLVKSIFADDPANITSTEKNLYNPKNDNFTMTGSESVLKKSCTQRQKLHWMKENVSDEAGDAPKSNVQNKFGGKRRKYKYSKMKPVRHRRNNRKTSPKRTTQSLNSLKRKIKYSKNFYKNSNMCGKKNFSFKYLQFFLNSFSHFANSKNIKFDVHINITPTLNKIPKPEGTSKRPSSDIKEDSAKKKRETEEESEPKLISLLDGAVNQSKYVIHKGAIPDITKNFVKVETNECGSNSIQPSTEIVKDVSELRAIIKDLTTTTENFIKENMEHIKCNKPYLAEITRKDKTNTINSLQGVLKTPTVSKAIQISNVEIKRQVVSGLKLKKEPKKKEVQENTSRLPKKSISYNIIESESILKVTDMTSAAEEINTDKVINKALNTALPKSKSQLEMNVGHYKKKLLTYYCDELIKSRQFQNHNAFVTNSCRYTACPHKENEHLINEHKYNREREQRKDVICIGPQQKISISDDGCEICGPDYSCSSVYIQIDDRSKKFTVRSGGVGFWEGFLYCILLWIPVVVILWLIYVYVIKDLIQPSESAAGRKSFQILKNSSFFLTPSDLGF